MTLADATALASVIGRNGIFSTYYPHRIPISTDRRDGPRCYRQQRTDWRKPMTPCVFCDRSQFEDHLIAKVDGFHIIATLGQITDGGYVLVAPEKHMPCLGALAGNTASGLWAASYRVLRVLLQEYPQTSARYSWIMFEHGIVDQTIQHAHLHIIPQYVDVTSRIRVDFPDSEIRELLFPSQFQAQYNERPRPYLFWTDKYGNGMVCWDPPAPAQYLRIVVAEMLKRPERANWRTMDSELDKKLWSETVRRLKPHFA
ncbi:MAG: hypothetical protein UY70_C0015G0007 [Candidatus Kaiserbacteria bacterium GW2011_GWB1_52_6]|uniref:HIT domain-containing protein n=2 Tax=Candidatus Kaiseribacteriota TaxID=1752734 RepID=A0A0G1X8M6_9BACT|nr:MAG: hypothetical protein UY67_C0009G0024 [Candidatus Kaiserbacteria bacterium GW2011_GWA2_52_12]KKW27386.1 MAG: hypothetical protein UY70_C0015G0007 [Candidatus Kaiserbacteria bacterium GW2011_GWB1_52_6]